MLKQIYHIAVRECGFLRKNPIYIFCMVIFPITCIIFFTSLMDEGQPIEMPIGVVDLDNTATTRSMIRKLDGFQTSHVVAHYPSVSEARQAIQRNQIYAFLYIPKGTTSGLLASRQPKISFYYSSITLVAGSTLFRDLKTVATLGSAAVGAAKLSAMGKTSKEIATFLQPIAVDLHMIGNPWGNYNIYLSTSMLPGVLMIFIFLITPYSIGTELKFKTSQELIRMAGGNIHVAIIGKMLPQLLIFLAIFYGYEVLYLSYSPVSAPWRHRPHPLGGTAGSAVGSVIRYLCLRLDALPAHVDEYLFAMGDDQLLNKRCHLSALCHESDDRSIGSTIPPTPLLYDLPDKYIQRIPSH